MEGQGREDHICVSFTRCSKRRKAGVGKDSIQSRQSHHNKIQGTGGQWIKISGQRESGVAITHNLHLQTHTRKRRGTGDKRKKNYRLLGVIIIYS